MQETEDFQIRTDIEPIYRHFPDLPKTENLKWCSTSSSGIGLTTTDLYLFAFYDDPQILTQALDGNALSDTGKQPELFFTPDDIKGQSITWREIVDAPFCFQDSIDNTHKMNTQTYLSDDNRILYLHAVGD